VSATPAAHAAPGEDQSLIGTRLERGLVTFFLLALIALPAASTLTRLLDVEFSSAAVLAKHLTLWVGFLGSLLAAASGRHLALSTVGAIPEGRWRDAAHTFGHAAAAAATALMTWASVLLVRSGWDGQGQVAFGIRESWSQLVIPGGFAVMSLRFAWLAGVGRRPWDGRLVALLAAGAAFALGWLPASSTLLTVLLLVTLVAFLLGAPVFVAMSSVAMALFFREGTPISAVPNAVFDVASNSSLPAIPLLTVAGYVLAEGGAARRLVRAYKGFFGWMPGGLAVMATFVCAVFTTFTGASGVTILAVGGLLYPALREDKYPEGFSLGLLTGAGSLGLLFPPSLPVILYAVVAKADIKELFIGGFVPGLLMVLLVSAYGIVVGVRVKAPRQPFEPREAFRALWGAKWDLGLPALVVVSFVSGYATIVESSALAAAYSIIVELAVFRELKPVKDLPRVLSHAATLVGSVVLLLGTALGVTSWFVDAEIPTRLVEWMTAHVHSPALFLLMLNVVLLVLGSVLEMYSAIVVLAPLVVPLGVQYGVDPIHLGVVFLANLELGFLFPPMGLNLFLAAQRFDKPLPSLYRHAFPFLLIMSAGVLAITYLPAITTGVVALFAG
jgi:tripartite ATP-independent transporter DctM subunit